MTNVLTGDCLTLIDDISNPVSLTFLDPPFNQGKDYALHNDDMNEDEYWAMLHQVCSKIRDITIEGGAIYFMHREKNAEFVLRTLRETGWTFQNQIIWKKMTSAVPCSRRYVKQYQILVYATKGKAPAVFNKLRIDPPLLPHQKHARENGMFVTDMWDDIRE